MHSVMHGVSFYYQTHVLGAGYYFNQMMWVILSYYKTYRTQEHNYQTIAG